MHIYLDLPDVDSSDCLDSVPQVLFLWLQLRITALLTSLELCPRVRDEQRQQETAPKKSMGAIMRRNSQSVNNLKRPPPSDYVSMHLWRGRVG